MLQTGFDFSKSWYFNRSFDLYHTLINSVNIDSRDNWLFEFSEDIKSTLNAKCGPEIFHSGFLT